MRHNRALIFSTRRYPTVIITSHIRMKITVNPQEIFLSALIIIFISLIILNYYESFTTIPLPTPFTGNGGVVPDSFVTKFPATTPTIDILNYYSTTPDFTKSLVLTKLNGSPASINDLSPFNWTVKGIPISNSSMFGTV